MKWMELKARLLEAGAIRAVGDPIPEECIGRSTAGPGAGGGGSVFFTIGGRRVRLSLDPRAPLELRHLGEGRAEIEVAGRRWEGRLEAVALHCPRQAYITLSERCIYRCKYCMVPHIGGQIKPLEQIIRRVDEVRDRIDAIAITSGVAESIEKDEERTCELVRRLVPLGLPIGVSIYPCMKTPSRLKDLGVREVKFNLETASERLFTEMCPRLDRRSIWTVLERSVGIFGENRVFSNVIVGLGETDAEMEETVEKLAGAGVIPVLRPLNPVPALPSLRRPAAERLVGLCRMEEHILRRSGLDTGEAETMCIACTGCDLVPGRDT